MLGKTCAIPKFFFFLLLAVALASDTIMCATAANESEAASALADADAEVTMAYMAVLEAEEAGANASRLLVRLNESGVLLARARMAYREAEFEETINLAISTVSIGVEVQAEAVTLKDAALSERMQRVMLTATASVFGIALIVFGVSWIWSQLRKRYEDSAIPKSNTQDVTTDER